MTITEMTDGYYDLPVPAPRARETAERDARLYALRPPAAIPATVVESEAMTRARREYEYCAQIRAAKARGATPLTAEQFFAPRDPAHGEKWQDD